MITETDAETALHWLQDNATVIAMRYGTRVYEEERLKIVMATLASRSEAKSIDGRKWEALTAPEYLEQVKRLQKACEAEKEINLMAKARELTVDLYRTQAANQRGRL